MNLLGKLFWVVLYLVATFCFVVLFENGPSNYLTSLQRTFDKLVVEIKNPQSTTPKR